MARGNPHQGILNHMSQNRNMKIKYHLEKAKLKRTQDEYKDFQIWIRTEISKQQKLEVKE